MDEDVGKLASATPVMICMSPYFSPCRLARRLTRPVVIFPQGHPAHLSVYIGSVRSMLIVSSQITRMLHAGADHGSFGRSPKARVQEIDGVSPVSGPGIFTRLFEDSRLRSAVNLPVNPSAPLALVGRYCHLQPPPFQLHWSSKPCIIRTPYLTYILSRSPFRLPSSLFSAMQSHMSICAKSALITRKQSINTNEQFDFLREIVSSIPDPTSAAAGPSSSSDPHSGGAGALPKRRSSGVDDGTGKKRGRKPKSSGVGAFPPHGQAGMGSGSYHYPGEEDENGRGHGYGHGYGHAAVPETKPAVLPSIGTWKRDMEGGGGMGEGGRGMFDDYEEDEEDY